MSFPLSGNITNDDKKSSFSYQYQTYEELHQSYYSISVFYNELKYTVIEDLPKTLFTDLVSNLGGIIGVFLGSSLVSIFEFVELFFQIIYFTK